MKALYILRCRHQSQYSRDTKQSKIENKLSDTYSSPLVPLSQNRMPWFQLALVAWRSHRLRKFALR